MNDTNKYVFGHLTSPPSIQPRHPPKFLRPSVSASAVSHNPTHTIQVTKYKRFIVMVLFEFLKLHPSVCSSVCMLHCTERVLWIVPSSAEWGDHRKIGFCCFSLLPVCSPWSVGEGWRSVHLQITSLSVSSLFCRLEKDSIQQSFSNEAKAQALQALQREQELTQKIQQMETQHDKTGGW